MAKNIILGMDIVSDSFVFILQTSINVNNYCPNNPSRNPCLAEVQLLYR